MSRPIRIKHIALYAMLCLIWGSTWLVIKVGYGELGPFNVAALRFYVAGFSLAPIMRFLGARWPKGRAEWGLVLWVGLVLFAADYGLIYWGEQYIDSGLTAILFATLPLITIVLAHVYVPGDRITSRKAGGTILAFLGVASLFASSIQLDPSKSIPMLAIIGSAVCAAASGVATKRYGQSLHPAPLTATAMLVGAVALTAVSFLCGDGFDIPTDLQTWGAILYLALAGSVFTFTVYFTLLKTWSLTSLSFVSVFTPAIALALGFLVLGERPTVWTGIGTVLILSGVMLALIFPGNVTHRDQL